MFPLINKTFLSALAFLVLAAPTAVEAKPATHGAAQAERQIRAQRGAFNRAIAIGDIKAIAAILADNTNSGDTIPIKLTSAASRP